MSLRIKTILIIGLAFASIILLLYIASQTILLSGFENLEAQNAEANIQRVLNAIDDSLSSMSSTNADWAFWDDTYEFIQDKNQTYVSDNLSASILVNLDINLMLFVNNAGQTVYSIAVDLDTGDEVSLPQGLAQLLSSESALVTHPDETSTPQGILLLAEGPILLTSRPILTNEQQGPIQGTLIMGRYIDDSKIQSLADSLKLSIATYPVNSPQLPEDFQSALAQLSDKQPTFRQPLGADHIASYAIANDLNGSPALLWRVDMPRDILAQGQTSVSFFALSLVVVALVGGIVTLLLLQKIVLARLGRLSQEVGGIRTSGDITARVSASGNDELSQLSAKINEMLDALAEFQAKRRESDALLRTIVDNIPIVLWAVDIHNRLTFLEGSDLQVLNIDPGRLIGRPVADLGGMIPLKSEDVQRVLAGGSFTTTITFANRTFEMRYSALLNQDGQVIGATGVAIDITVRQQTEEALRKANMQLDEHYQKLEQFHKTIGSRLEEIARQIKQGSTQTDLLMYIEIAQADYRRFNLAKDWHLS